MSLIKESSNPLKKYMVKVKTGNEIKTIHFGAKNYNDYTIYYKALGKKEADKKKAAYIARHSVNEDFNNPLTAGFWSRWVLWEESTVLKSLKKTIKKFKLKLEPFDE